MVHHKNRNRKEKLLKAVEKNGLTSSLNSNSSLSNDVKQSHDNTVDYSSYSYDNVHETQNAIYDSVDDTYDEIHVDDQPLSSGKSNNRVHFVNERVDEISNSRVQRIRGSFQKRKPNTTKCVLLRRNREIGFGFSIRGGVEHGTGIFISNINRYSDAHAQGLQVGDQILRANNALFEGILHDEAVQYIKRQKILQLIVLSLGVVPGNKIELTEYQWMDCYGQPCSPVITRREESGRRNETNSMIENGVTPSRHLLSADDERKVVIDAGNNVTLGLLIRGGREYGLGIYIAGIDQDSVADNYGIMVGEQILEINGIDFVNITHADAAEIIRTSRRMTMVLKDIGKIPISRIIYDKTEWIKREQLKQRENQLKNNRKDLIIQQGLAGKLSSHQSVASPVSFQWVEEKAKSILNQDDWSALKYHIREYARGNLTVNELGLSLLDLFDTDLKLQLMDEVRGIVLPKDIEIFDELILSMEVAAMGKNRTTSNRNKSLSPVTSSGHFQQHHQDETYGNETHDVFANNTITENNDFNYRALNEDTYQSVFEDLTDETELNITEPNHHHHPKHRTLLDEALSGFDRLETVIESKEEGDEEGAANENEPVYAKVIKRPKLTEYGQTSTPSEMSTFKSLPNERHLHQSPEKDRKSLKSPPLVRREIRNGDSLSPSEKTETGNENLGFAFSFLNSQENSPHLSQKSFTNSPLKGSANTSPQMSSRNRIYRDLTGSQNQRTEERGSEETTATEMEQQSSFHTYQPKSFGSMPAGQRNTGSLLGKEYSFRSFDEKSNAKQSERIASGIKVIGGNEYNLQFDKQNSPISPDKPQFDISKSIDKHYSNFSVNDIVRQNFLPTTRVHRDSNEQENEIKTILQNRKNPNREEETRTTSLTRLSSLNIQNQYQYQKSSRTISPIMNNDETEARMNSMQTLSIGPESYGKPIISPRMSYESPSPLPLPPQSLLDSTNESIEPRQTKYKPIISRERKKATVDDEKRKISNQNERNMFSMERLKKTPQGTVLLDRETNREEQLDVNDETDTNEYTASKLLGTMSLSIERLDEENKNQLNSTRDVGGAILSKEGHDRSTQINRPPRYESSEIDNKLQMESNSHELSNESSVSILRQKINQTLGGAQHDLNQQQQPSPASEKKTMQKWIQQTDFRPKITNPKFRNSQSPREKAASNQLKSRIDVFSKQSDSITPYEKFMKQKKDEENEPKLRTVSIPNTRDDPGFQVDVRTNEKGEQEVYVAGKTNIALTQIQLDDVIVAVGDHQFKTGVRKGLANRIILNKFSSTENDHVALTLK